MELAYCTDSMGHLSFEDMLDESKRLGIKYLEIATGGWSSAPHLNVYELLEDKSKFDKFKHELEKRELEIIALNCSGNPLSPCELGDKHRDITEKTMELAQKLGVTKIVMMSGQPAGAPGDKIPNWISYTASLPPTLRDVIEYQWNDVAIPYWKELVKKAKACGVEKIALENFGGQLVYNPKTLFKLRDAVDPIIGLNLDPSHLMWMGADPIAVARALGDAIYHVHAKDARIEKTMADVNTLLEYEEVEKVTERTWNYVAVGCGKDLQWWKEFFSVVRMMGYNDHVSLEMEDLTMSIEAGIQTSIDALNLTLSK